MHIASTFAYAVGKLFEVWTPSWDAAYKILTVKTHLHSCGYDLFIHVFHVKGVLSNQEYSRYLKRKFTGSVQGGPKVIEFTVRVRFAYFVIENGTHYICINFPTFVSWLWSSFTSNLASKECVRSIELSGVTVHSSSFGQIPRSRSSIFGIVTRLQVGRSGVQIPVWAGDLSFFPKCPDWPWDPPSQVFGGYRGSFTGVKQPEHEVDHLPPSSAEVQERVKLYHYYPHMPPWC
jgi:hypothetical protein